MLTNKTTDHIAVLSFIELLVLHGITTVISSPGSRNAPFIIAFKAQKGIDILTIVDERSAAFFALGIAQYTKHPVVLLCTSGTALLNYSPAISEAFYQNIPLIIVSADRPEHLINQAESQTIMQNNAFNNHVVKSYNFPTLKTKEDFSFNNRLMNEAIILSKIKSKPVHLNFHLKEPLYNTTTKEKSFARRIEIISHQCKIRDENFKILANKINTTKKVMILGGSHFLCKELKNSLQSMDEKCRNIVILLENITNASYKNSISTIDRVISTITEDEMLRFKPEILITFGGILVTRMIKTFLRNHPPKEHWQISKEENLIDSYNVLTMQIPVSTNYFFKNLLPYLKPLNSFYTDLWKTRNSKTLKNHLNFITSTNWSDLKAFDIVLMHVPKGSVLQLGNSTVVRYAQLFDSTYHLEYYSNRGTSGIEGSISTAIGSNYISKKLTTIIVGDQSFLYDSNALWNNYLQKNVKIIVINNGGGGIFRFIDGPLKTDYLEEYFEVKHSYNFKNIAKQFNIKYHLAKTEKKLIENLYKLYSNKEVEIVEVQTPREKNAVILKKYFKKLKT